MKQLRGPYWAIGILAFFAFFALPVIPVEVVPQWTVRVTDEQGHPRPNTVREIWHHYSFDGSGLNPLYGGEEDLVTDDQGVVVFPERRIHVSLGMWGIATVGTPMRWINIHASTGPYAYLLCLNPSCGYAPDTYSGDRESLENTTLIIPSPETRKRQEEESNLRLKDGPVGYSSGDSGTRQGE